jgi:hypothetical protein
VIIKIENELFVLEIYPGDSELGIKSKYPALKHDWINSTFNIDYGTVFRLPGKWSIQCDKYTGKVKYISATWRSIEWDKKSLILRGLFGKAKGEQWLEEWEFSHFRLSHSENEYYECVQILFK